MNIVVVSGSPRPQRTSHQVALEVYNRLNNMENVSVTLLDVKEADFPNLDYVYKKNPSVSDEMKKFSETIAASDGIIIVSPEYNGSFSGALKNAIDYFYGEFSKKVIGVVSVSTGKMGGIRAVMDLQKLILALGAFPLPKYLTTPEVQNLFSNGLLVDDRYGKQMEVFINEFLWLTEAVKNQKEKSLYNIAV
ncbi:MAG: NAD(P)H-dependent oxidoreductase [Ignavibacteria bacterium]|nr:NAD(P)H-dependent oxidoreductase [Ignavibacteria bacterium]